MGCEEIGMSISGNRAAVARLCVPGLHLDLTQFTNLRSEGAEIITAAATTEAQRSAAARFAAGRPPHSDKAVLADIVDGLTGTARRIAEYAIRLSASNFVYDRPTRAVDPTLERRLAAAYAELEQPGWRLSKSRTFG